MGKGKIIELLALRKQASWELRVASLQKRNNVIEILANKLNHESAKILEANARDLKELPDDVPAAFRDRLTLTAQRLAQAIESLKQIQAAPDPLDEEVEKRTLANGIKVRKIRSPLGVILIIFESRPNVTLEAFSLAIKSGNVPILRGGRESRHSTASLYDLQRVSLKESGLSENCFMGITDPDRELLKELLKQSHWIDVVIPRGGDGLIQFVVEHSRIPIIKNDRGLCHVYVHQDADLKMALEIVANAKLQRPGVCNAMETLLVHKSLAEAFLPMFFEKSKSKGLVWYGCDKTLKILGSKDSVFAALPAAWDTEYLDYKMNCRVVDSLEQAIEHIEIHGSRHSEAIITRSEGAARKFQKEIDAAVVYWNASTRFTDGFELGLGGEIGVSTQKLHARGPVGLKELTSVRWLMDGVGQIRS